MIISVDDLKSKLNQTIEESASRNFKWSQVEHVIKEELSLMNKLKGTDLIKAKERARDKIVKEEDMDQLLAETNEYIKSVHEDMLHRKHLKYEKKEITKLRNSLIAVATVRIAHRESGTSCF